MKFISTHGNLLKGLSAVSPLAGRNTQLPALQHVLLEVKEGILNLTCTDLEVGAHVAVTGKAEKDGRCTVPARQLLEYVQQLPVAEPLVVELKKNRLSVTTKGFSASFPVSEVEDFPLLPQATDEGGVTLDGRLLSQAFGRCVFAAARDEARPEIYSLLIQAKGNEMRIAATDSFRLAEQVLKLEEEHTFSFLLPINAANEVARLFSASDQLTVQVQDNFVAWQAEGVYLTARLVDGTYPDYRQIIPSKFLTSGVVKRDELIRALKVLGVFLPRDSRRVNLAVKPDKDLLELSVAGSEAGEGKVGLVFDGTGEDVEALFNIQYLLEGVQHGHGDNYEVSLSGASDPIMLRPPDKASQYVYIVMPIQT